MNEAERREGGRGRGGVVGGGGGGVKVNERWMNVFSVKLIFDRV